MANKKVIGAAALTAAIAGGGALGMLIGSPVVSGAQTEDPTTTTAPSDESTTTAPDSTAPETTPAPDDTDKPEDCADGRGFGHHGGFDLAVAAEALGITEDELRTQLQDGSSIADIATERGVDLQTVIDALVADATADIDEKLANGDIDAERADELKANLAERATDFVQHEGLRGGPGGRGGHGPR